jgi:hypothetical protein
VLAKPPGGAFVFSCTLLARCLSKLPAAIHFHSLRHKYASRLVQRGASVYKVQALLGHASVGTTQQYAHLTGSELRAEVETALRTGPTEVELLREEVARLWEPWRWPMAIRFDRLFRTID